MAPTRVGLMGFGHLGRSLFRILYPSTDIRVAAISDAADPESLTYLLRFDTVRGRFPVPVTCHDRHIYVDGRQIPLLDKQAPGDVPWQALGVDTVIETTARPLSRKLIERHLECGAKRVILCTAPEDQPDVAVAMGVNDEQLRCEHRIVATGSATAGCAAPIVKFLHSAFGIERAFLSTVHAYTDQQRLADVPATDMRRGRAAAENIIPQETNAAELVAELVPELAGRITGGAIHVPVANGSVVDLVCWHRRPVTRAALNETVRTAAQGSWRGIVAYEDEPIVSSDILHSPASSIFDSQATMVQQDKVSKTLAWFDNSWGYAHRLADLIRRFIELDKEASS